MNASTLTGRLAATATGLALPLLLAAPAFAAGDPNLDDGEVNGPPLGVTATVLIFVVVPVVAFLLIAFLVMLPSMRSRARYRPGRPWNHDPLWFAGPDEPEEALRVARAGTSARGGASAEW